MKKVLILVLVLAMALALVACGTKTTEESTAPTASATVSEGGKIGIAMPTKSLERWNRDGSFLQTQFEAKGYEVELKYSDNDVTQQVADIENMIADKVNLLVIVAIDGESLSTVLQSAVDAI